MQTRLMTRFGLAAPIVLAPMALAAGGALAAGCARAGALALLGGGYGDLAWTMREYDAALALLRGEDAARLGCGFITWKLALDDAALRAVLAHAQAPRAIMLSFGDPRPFAAPIRAAGAALICQIQRMEQLPQALEAGAEVIVAQGAEAGGHGMRSATGRATFTLVPEVADYLAAHAPDTLLLAAGGIADGRGLAASLMLGADGALVGTRLWACRELLAPRAAQEHAIAQDGDQTARSAIFDILRRKDWPAEFDFRALRNPLHQAWEGRIDALRAAPGEAQAQYDAGVQAGDYSRAHVTVGEAVGLLRDVPAAGDWITQAWAQAQSRLRAAAL